MWVFSCLASHAAFLLAHRLTPDLAATDFRLRAMTFDSVPWVVTMKKNEHYFPTAELVKGPREECGWRRITYEGRRACDRGRGL